jgi:1,4-dihydroxy-2-naphthoate octaprenyltransferase
MTATVDKPGPDKTRFARALRPFSLVVALATCGLGVSLALLDGYRKPWLGLGVLLAGVLLQAGVNLINDASDRDSPEFDQAQRQRIGRNAGLGWLAIGAAALFGLYTVLLRGWPMLALCLIGMFGAWGYTGGPVDYKQRGLGVPLVFLLMGVLLVGGAYYVVSGAYNPEVFWLSLPFSLFASLLLLSNELRDFEIDREAGRLTLTVRLGYRTGALLFRLIIALLAVATVALGVTGLLGYSWIPLLSLLALLPPLGLLETHPERRMQLARATGRGFFAYGAAMLAALWLAAS